MSESTPTIERFWRHVHKTDGCWEWIGYLTPRGYGRFWDGESVRPVHRIAYELFVGPFPQDLTIDHLCRNKGCVNPAHLEPVTNAENKRRTPQRTHCPKGHPYSPENTRVNAQGSRVCRQCWRRPNKSGRRSKYNPSGHGHYAKS